MSCTNNLSNLQSTLWNQMQWYPSEEQLNQIIRLQSSLEEWNKKVNLTRLLHGEDYWITQIFDSLWALKRELKYPQKQIRCIDVGSGCGLPGIAIAIAIPGMEITLVDSANKKTTALKDIAKQIGLASRITIRNERIEETGQNPMFRQKFDLAIARAVAPANVVAEYLIPLLKPKGEALIYKGRWTFTEENLLKNALIPLNAKLKTTQKCELPKNRGIRHVIRLLPNGKCPVKYPRPIGTPSKKPLGA